MKLAAAVAVLTATSIASAEPYDATEPHKDAGVAIGLSVGGTAASIGLIAAGANMSDRAGGPGLVTAGVLSLIVTPALGEIYSGKYFTPGMGMRLAGGGLAVIGAMEALSHLCFGNFDNGTSTDSSCSSNATPDYFPVTMLGIGAALAVSGTIYDIATAGTAAEHWNNAHHLALAPTMIPSTTGPTAGVALGGVF